MGRIGGAALGKSEVSVVVGLHPAGVDPFPCQRQSPATEGFASNWERLIPAVGCAAGRDQRMKSRNPVYFWCGLTVYLGSIAVLLILGAVLRDWIVAIGFALLWFATSFVLAALLVSIIEMPRQAWKALETRFPRKRKVNEELAECVGHGTLNGVEVYFAIIVDEAALSIRVCRVASLRPMVISIPWDRIEIVRVGLNSKRKYTALVTIPELWNCDIELPWRRHFPKGAQSKQALPSESG